jgi:hypothetical protein
MLEYEWRELERLCERLADLRHREAFAQRSKNVGLLEGLKQDITRASRQREQLVRYISARLGSVSAEKAAAPDAVERSAPARPTAAEGPAVPASGRGDGDSDSDSEIVGFLS